MRELLIGDLHFGIKNNSTFWLESEISFFRNQIFKIIETEELDRIVFLGDITDVRYAINQQIGIELKNIIRDLALRYKNDIYFIAGNHDYYSPLEEFSKYNSYELLFGPEFLEKYKNLHFVTLHPEFTEDGSLMLPFYWTENAEHFDEILYTYNFSHDVKAIYCHADLTTWPGGRISSLKGCPIYSGHIHYIYDDPIGNLHNLGAALALTFADVNQERYLYILEDYKIVKKIPNTTTPKFIRLYNDEIFNVNENIFNNSYVQLCISSQNINKANYIEQIKNLKSTFINANIRIHIIDNISSEEEHLDIEGINTNIQEYIDKNIPDYLENKYEIIKDKLIDK